MREENKNTEHVLLSSIVIGFIISNIAKLVPVSISYEFDAIVLSITSLCFGFLCAKIYMNSKFKNILYDVFKINQTIDLYIWDTIVNSKCPTLVEVVTNDTLCIKGFPDLVEGFTDNPHITLANYRIYNCQGELIEESDVNTTILLDLSNVKYYKFHYRKDSERMHELEELSSNRYEDYI